MNHSFQASHSDPMKCGHLDNMRMCGHSLVSHTDKAECEFCNYVGNVEPTINNELSCPECMNKVNIKKIHPNSVITMSRQVDASVQSKEDFFNLETVSIVDIKDAIEKDESITNKPYELAKLIDERLKSYKSAIFDLSAKLMEANKRQASAQIYMNNLANSLHESERNKFKLVDINYKPAEKKPKTPKLSSPKPKLVKAEVAATAKELGIPEATFRMILLQKNMTVSEGAAFWRRQLALMQSTTK